MSLKEKIKDIFDVAIKNATVIYHGKELLSPEADNLKILKKEVLGLLEKATLDIKEITDLLVQVNPVKTSELRLVVQKILAVLDDEASYQRKRRMES